MGHSITPAMLVALFASGCATAPATPARGETQASVIDSESGPFIRLGQQSASVIAPSGASPERIWSVLPAVYEKLGIRADINEAATRTIGTRSFTQSRLDGKRTSDWIRCGNQGSGPSSGGMYRTRLSIITSVEPASGGGSKIVTEIGGIATPVEGTSTGPVTCVSLGTIEQRIRELVDEQIARTPQP